MSREISEFCYVREFCEGFIPGSDPRLCPMDLGDENSSEKLFVAICVAENINRNTRDLCPLLEILLTRVEKLGLPDTPGIIALKGLKPSN